MRTGLKILMGDFQLDKAGSGAGVLAAHGQMLTDFGYAHAAGTMYGKGLYFTESSTKAGAINETYKAAWELRRGQKVDLFDPFCVLRDTWCDIYNYIYTDTYYT